MCCLTYLGFEFIGMTILKTLLESFCWGRIERKLTGLRTCGGMVRDSYRGEHKRLYRDMGIPLSRGSRETAREQ